MRTRTTAALAVLLAASAAPGGDEPAAKGLDAALDRSLRAVISRGAALYNKGEHAACYRVFQGGLTAAEGLLDHRPDLRKTVATALAAAERDPLVWRRAFTLRAALDKVRKGLAAAPPEKPKVEPDKQGAEQKKDEKQGEGDG